MGTNVWEPELLESVAYTNKWELNNIQPNIPAYHCIYLLVLLAESRNSL